MTSLEGRVALVTGAARGMGRSHAVELARVGADVIALDLCAPVDSVTDYPPATPADLAETAALVEGLDRRVVTRQVDVRDRAAMLAAVAEGVAELGGLHVVVANAGVVSPSREASVQAFFDAVSIDLGGVFTTVEAAYPHLGEGASIILIGSMAALMGMGDQEVPAGALGYVHAKRGVGRYAHDLAALLAPHGIRVNAVHPGNVRTDMVVNETMFRTARPDLAEPTLADAEVTFRRMHKLPVGLIEPADISNAVVYLAGDTSRYVTGLQLKVEAGALLTRGSGIPG
jgi:SDR family mycofactocin-dependent oxidoreductase